jgi:hypothetical protein
MAVGQVFFSALNSLRGSRFVTGLLACAGLSGCILGGGPVLALRHGYPALGWEAGGGPMFLRSDIGQSTPVAGPQSGNRLSYAGVTAQFPLALLFATRSSNNTQSSSIPDYVLMGTSLGGVWGKDDGGFYANGFGSLLYLPDGCHDNQMVATLALGVRWIGTASEFYVAPRADIYWPLCIH